ncbi:hypothetical protein [Nocardia cyriacigeorgica]|uniref:hypothetical protein n=1 Tax=Nocardia cyriacigeorgica TaxID=135487 RepID=UPI00189390BC|nr:hypothetical protein [Nocardia cyriacigeorgica]MBF6287827.1 hypothetical protein [Nocardia cyriacigeorgica]
MSYPVDQLPDISVIGGTWTIVTARDCAFGHPVKVGQAHFPDWEWPYQPENCPIECGSWYLNETLLLCNGCGTDGT